MSNLLEWLAIAPELVNVREKLYRGDPRVEICPPRELCLRALEELAPDDVRVVLLGQDPYHTAGRLDPRTERHSAGKASGLAFGYHRDYAGSTDSSLLNIITELGASPADFDRTLEPWSRQGVLLLNTRLSVEAGKPMSHAGKGWEAPILQVLSHLSRRVDVIWLLLGAEARNMVQMVGVDPHLTVATSHPCRYSAGKGFLGSSCFQKVNEKLRTPIAWLDGETSNG